jgi:predicted dehydrogenase
MSTVRKLKLAFIGGGVNSAIGRIHKIASEMDSRFELTAGCFSRNFQINKETGVEYGILPENMYNSWKDLTTSGRKDIDAVVILTPPYTRKPIVLSCIENNLPVICEKPLSDNIADALMIKTAVEKKGSFLAVTFNYTGYPMVREIRDIVRSGLLGNVHQIILEMPQEGFIRLKDQGTPVKPQEWRLEDRSIPTLSLDLGVHLHNLITFLTGVYPVRVVSSQKNYGNFKDIVDNISCMAEYPGNMSVNFWYTKTSLGNRNGLRLRMFGDKGSIEWLQLKPDEILFCDNFGNRSIIDRGSGNVKIASNKRYMRFKPGHPDGFLEAFSNYYYDLADELNRYKKGMALTYEFMPDFNTVVNGLKMMEAIDLSHSNSGWVNC